MSTAAMGAAEETDIDMASHKASNGARTIDGRMRHLLKSGAPILSRRADRTDHAHWMSIRKFR
jgi:hypothetical protein